MAEQKRNNTGSPATPDPPKIIMRSLLRHPDIQSTNDGHNKTMTTRHAQRLCSLLLLMDSDKTGKIDSEKYRTNEKIINIDTQMNTIENISLLTDGSSPGAIIIEFISKINAKSLNPFIITPCSLRQAVDEGNRVSVIRGRLLCANRLYSSSARHKATVSSIKRRAIVPAGGSCGSAS